MPLNTNTTDPLFIIGEELWLARSWSCPPLVLKTWSKQRAAASSGFSDFRLCLRLWHFFFQDWKKKSDNTLRNIGPVAVLGSETWWQLMETFSKTMCQPVLQSTWDALLGRTKGDKLLHSQSGDPLLKPQWYPCLGTLLFPFLFKEGVQKFPRLRSRALQLATLHPSLSCVSLARVQKKCPCRGKAVRSWGAPCRVL